MAGQYPLRTSSASSEHHGHFRPSKDMGSLAMLSKTSNLYPSVSMIRPPRVIVQDENKNGPTRQQQPHPSRQPLQTRVLQPRLAVSTGHSGNILKEPAQAGKYLQNMAIPIKPVQQSTMQPDQGVSSRKAKALVKLPVPAVSPSQKPLAAGTAHVPNQTTGIKIRPRSMLPAAIAPKAMPVLSRTASASASTAIPSRRQPAVSISNIKAGLTRLSLTKPDSGSIRKSSSTAMTSSRHNTMSTVLSTSAPVHSSVLPLRHHQCNTMATAPAAPKMPLSKRHRMQASALERVTTQTIQQPIATRDTVKLRKARTSLVPSFDSRLYLDTDVDMSTDLNVGGNYHTTQQELDLDVISNQDDVHSDPTLVLEYQAEIFAYQREMEIKLLPDPDYMCKQVSLTWHYRVQLIEWLVQVHDRFNLLQETMHLCINYLDRFLSRILIPIDQLQLAGTVALLLASKYEEIQSPAIEMLAYLGGNAHSPDRIREAEIGMLRALNYDMGVPGPMSFLRRISRADNYDIDIRTLAKYLIDVTLCDHRFIALPSSMIAAIGYCASMRLLFRGEWSVEHQVLSGYTETMLAAGINALLTMLEQPLQTHHALYTKYQGRQYMHSSSYVQRLGLSTIRSLHSESSF